jgi:hypothetical protein
MSNSNTQRSHALTPVDVEVVSDPSAIEAAYADNVYDPRRDVRNQYPMIAQQMLLNPEMRKGLNEMASDVCSSGLYGFKNREADHASVRMVALKGFAMGMDLPRALETIKVIHGMPTIRGPQALHLIRERTRGAILDCVESTEERCEWKLARPGARAKTFCATREEVGRAGLPDRNDLWNRYPKRMLKWHAFSEGAQELFGDVLMGCYITEEINIEARFLNDLDNAVAKSERTKSSSTSTSKRGSRKAAKKAGDKKQPAPGSKDPSSWRARDVDVKKLRARLSELVSLRGGRRPTEDMDEEQARLVKQERDNLRQSTWEAISKSALDGKVAKRESLTSEEVGLLLSAFETRITMMREQQQKRKDQQQDDSGS